MVTANFAKRLLENNLNPTGIDEFLKTAKQVNTVKGFGDGFLLINEDEKKIISAQTAFGLETLENLQESWEYLETGTYERIKALEP